jgi:hypothetical protein
MRKMLAWLRHEWTKNDGKKARDWEPGFDLKSAALWASSVLIFLLLMAAFALGGAGQS